MKTRPDGITVTQSLLEESLRSLGLTRGDAVEVHSSLSSFGLVEGGAAAVVNALMEVVGADGAIIMSAYPVSKPLPLSPEEKEKGILAKVKIFDEAYDGPSGMGIIADEFRHRYGTVLGNGIHRVCAWGRDADRHSKGFERLLEMDGRVLLLGVGIDRCSGMHLAEKAGIPREVLDYFHVPDEIRREYPADIHIAYGRTPEDGWAKIQAAAERQGLIKRRMIGTAEGMLFKARPVIGIYEAALHADPLGLFGVEKKHE